MGGNLELSIYVGTQVFSGFAKIVIVIGGVQFIVINFSLYVTSNMFMETINKLVLTLIMLKPLLRD